MKLVQLLAKELKEWPEGVSCMVQDSDGKICTCLNGFPDPYYGDWTICGPTSIDSPVVWADKGSNKQDLAHDQASAIITIEAWQAEREKMNKPKWVRARGKKPNYETEYPQRMHVRHRDGSTTSGWTSQAFNWSYLDGAPDADIMAYCVLPMETKEQEINQVKDTNLGTLTYKLEIDATEATQQIDSLVAKWCQIESPLKWRDEIIELEAYEEEFRRERENLIRKLESEGFKLIDHMAPVYGFADVDMSDWRNWEIGDIVLIKNDPDVSDGEHEITDLEGNDYDGDLPVQAGGGWADFSEANVKFIRRP